MSGKIFACANCGRDIMREPCRYCGYPIRDQFNEDDLEFDQEVDDRIERTELIGKVE